MTQSELKEILEKFYKGLYDEHATMNYVSIDAFKNGYGYLQGAYATMQVALKAFQSNEDVREALKK